MPITLLSDFGLHDASVAVARGVLIQYTNDPIIDITHEVKPFYMPQAAYLLASAYNKFPKGSFHLVLFDLFSDDGPQLILSAHDGHYFLAPDNGVLPAALGRLPSVSKRCPRPEKGFSFTDWLHASGNIISKPDIDQLINSLPDYSLKQKNRPIQTDKTNINCEVIHIDRYENVVLNFTKQQYEQLAPGRLFQLCFSQVEEINEVRDTYADVRPGYKLCRFNSNGFLEICINRGQAASLFGLSLGNVFNDIKISFE